MTRFLPLEFFDMTARLLLSAAALTELHSLPDDALLTTQEAAAFLNVSPSTLSWYRSRRLGPGYKKFGTKSVRYCVGVLRQYSNAITPGAGRPKLEG